MAPPDETVAELREMGCEFHALSMPSHGLNPFADLSFLRRLRAQLNALSPHAFLSYTIKPNIYGSIACRALGIPSMPNVSGLGTAFLAGGWLSRIIQSLYAYAFSSCSRVCFQNADDEALFVQRRLVQPHQTLRLSGSGIDLSHFQPSALPDPNPIRFLFIGRLLRDKGLVEFATAAQTVKRLHPHVQFDVLGAEGGGNPSAVPAATLRTWAETGLLNVLGTAKDVRPWIARSHCVVLPSYREGAPRALIEAAAMARPLIATDVPGCRDVVDEGTNGYLCAPRSGEDLARVINQFIALDAGTMSQMGSASRRVAEARFDQRAVVEQVMGAVRDAVKG